MADGACRETGLEFVPASVSAARLEQLKVVCRGCRVLEECLTYALGDDTLVGVWGGTTERERKEYRQGAEARDKQALAAVPPWLAPEERAHRAKRRGARLRVRRPAG